MIRLFLTIYFSLSFAVPLFGESLPLLPGKISGLQNNSPFRSFIHYFTDSKDKNFRERIFAKDTSLSFRNIPAEMFSLGFTEDTAWFYIPLKNDTSNDYHGKFEIYNPYLEKVDIHYRYGHKDRIYEILAGANRAYEANFPVLDFYLRPGEEIQIVCAIKSGTPLRIPFVLESEKKYNFTEQFRSIAVGLTLGFGIAMGLYNLSLYFSFRARSYLYYFIMILFSTVYLTSWDGLTLPLFKPTHGRHYLPLTLVLIYTSTLFLFLFSLEFLYPEKKDKGAEIITAIYVVSNLILIPLSIFYPIQLNQFSYYLGLINNLIIVYFCIVKIRDGFKPAKNFLLIHMVFPIAGVLANLSTTGTISINYFSLHLLKLAFVSQSILFSVMLVQRIKELEFKLKEGLQSEIHKNIILLKKEIQQRRETEWELIQAKEIAEKASKVKSSFLANMSHEIRTPMNGVLGMVQLLGTTKLNDEQKEYIQILSISAKSLLQIINDILDFSKIEAGKISLDKEVFSIHSVLDEIHDLLYPLAKQKRIGLRLEDKSEIQEYVYGDQLRLRQILWNLTGNGIKFTNHGEVVLNVSQKNISKDKISIKFTVSDSGIGIPLEKQKQVFDAFSQSDTSTARKFGGSGLGLSITKQLVELQGGTLNLESKESYGSKFTFTITYDIPSESEIEKILEAEKTKDLESAYSNATSKSMKILVAEDNETNCLLIERALKKLGYDPVVVHNGREVIEKMQLDFFDMILMDIHMPEVDGIEATKWIRSQKQNTEFPIIIALTADVIESNKEVYISKGMNDYLTKPLDLPLFKKTLDFWSDHVKISHWKQ
ncbi:hybrid sensor histidine kinase/response regulator [Leptospira borgpetersenii]|uniref:Sensory/regulatory protein RpfC n=1 Tax=Leptospira borgpetersenii serovar Javanica str. UI 09931 TaxID=1049767 RepID=A0AAV3JCN4_LEPBO|nr:hybrid sensor histidine kinase/response regulator [Leptospira borgpetersenii]AXX14424.1 hybrid sensor histidine kinase/response regulator [Leptospira borgpetersenii serovar Ceylonica]EKQ92265.1 7TM diverse intracellular signaling [Leptospira borgpetersenii str. UI 09149]EMN59189.1 7TM diverse intracellular signaling [Leptospira borgpetersenii serovar Javanica str. MK146]EPG57585.1 7TM diverse intracellular signaling [Leptospira borgpetersenii serovar Javanica str. UI 09931]MDQ7242843.1 7TM 